MSSRSHKNLIVWNKSMNLTLVVYKLLRNFPREEIFGISSQIKRATVSIPSNIAEGSKRKGDKEFLHFLRIAYGSGAEVETQIEISKRLGFGKIEEYVEVEENLTEIMKMLNVLITRLSANN